MGVTKNYKLYVEDNPLTKFLEWRKKMNGSSDSNIAKIDTILGDKADSSKCVRTTLSSAKWVGESAPYTQELKIEGMTADQNGNIFITSDASAEAVKAASDAPLSIQSQLDGSLVVAADKKKPNVDIPVGVILLG